MHSPELERARSRLQNAQWRSQTTEVALHLIEREPSDTSLIDTLDLPEEAPGALEAFSALDTSSEVVYEAVRDRISQRPLMSWCLVESLNRLPWYNGMRAFLSLPDTPTSSPCAYPFYILVRNKIFIPSNMGGEIYHYYVNGLWRSLPLARSGDWQRPHHSVLAILEMIERHFENGCPDTFVLYFACLLLGRIGSFDTGIQSLQELAEGGGCPTARKLATMTLEHLRPHDCGTDCCRAATSAHFLTCRRCMQV